jgi:hypothetical protein
MTALRPVVRAADRRRRSASEEVSVHVLRNHMAEVLRRVEAGEHLRVTVAEIGSRLCCLTG